MAENYYDTDSTKSGEYALKENKIIANNARVYIVTQANDAQ